MRESESLLATCDCAEYLRRTEARLREEADRAAAYMALEAYEAAAAGNHAVVRDLLEVLSAPYDDQSAETEARWGGLTPPWARNRPGVTFMT